jgi:hypothetical protein
MSIFHVTARYKIMCRGRLTVSAMHQKHKKEAYIKTGFYQQN